jgi:hypothetical protein
VAIDIHNHLHFPFGEPYTLGDQWGIRVTSSFINYLDAAEVMGVEYAPTTAGAAGEKASEGWSRSCPCGEEVETWLVLCRQTGRTRFTTA